MSRYACHLDALVATSKLRKVTPTSEPVLMSDQDREDIDMAMHRHKQPRPGNPLVDGYEADRQARAVGIECGSRRHS